MLATGLIVHDELPSGSGLGRLSLKSHPLQDLRPFYFTDKFIRIRFRLPLIPSTGSKLHRVHSASYIISRFKLRVAYCGTYASQQRAAGECLLCVSGVGA